MSIVDKTFKGAKALGEMAEAGKAAKKGALEAGQAIDKRTGLVLPESVAGTRNTDLETIKALADENKRFAAAAEASKAEAKRAQELRQAAEKAHADEMARLEKEATAKAHADELRKAQEQAAKEAEEQAKRHADEIAKLQQVPVADLKTPASGAKLSPSDLKAYARDGIEALNRQTSKNGSHNALDTMHKDFADGLRKNGILIDKRAFRNEMTNPKAVEAHIRMGKPVTEGEYQHMVDFHRRKLEAGPAVKEVDLLKQHDAAQPVVQGWKKWLGITALRNVWAKVSGDTTPNLRSSPSLKHLGTVTAVAAATGVGLGLKADLEDPARLNTIGRIADLATNLPGGDNYGLWRDYKFNVKTLGNEDRMKLVGEAVDKRQADPIIKDFYNATRTQKAEKTVAENKQIQADTDRAALQRDRDIQTTVRDSIDAMGDLYRRKASNTPNPPSGMN